MRARRVNSSVGEKMKRNEVLKHFPDATDEQITGILNQFAGEYNSLKSELTAAKEELDRTKNELVETRDNTVSLKLKLAEADEKIKAGMSAEERLAAREKEAEERELEYKLKSNALDAKSIFVASGYFDDSEIHDLLKQVVSEDTEATKTFANKLVATIGKQREVVETTTKDSLLKSNPHLSGSSGGGVLSKEAFDKMTYEERFQAMQENPGLLKSFNTN